MIKHILLWTLSTLLILVILIASYAGITYWRASSGLPEWNGTLTAEGLDGAVEIIRDEHGIPYIEATTEREPYFAQGIVNSQKTSPPAAEQTSPVPRFEPGPCPFLEGTLEDGKKAGADNAQAGVRCGTLIVEERRNQPNTRLLRLAVAIVESTSDDPAPDPLVYLMGGPGNALLRTVPDRLKRPFWKAIRAKRDLIFFDRRGTGYSEPRFCPELNRLSYYAPLRGLPQEALTHELVHGASACRKNMISEGTDVSAYNSTASALDLDELRQALGYERWNLYGISYGARLALTALRDVPEGIRSVILDAVYPPNVVPPHDRNTYFKRSLRLVFDQCKADAVCRAAYPTLEETFFRTLKELQRNPFLIAVNDTTLLPKGHLQVNGGLFAASVLRGLTNPGFISVLPPFIDAVAQRDQGVIEAVSDGLLIEPSAFNRSIFMAVQCYEEAPFQSPDRIAADRRQHPRLDMAYPYLAESLILPEVCDALHTKRADSLEQQAVISDVPALLFNGEFDPITPPDYGHLAARTLSNATVVDVPAMGHGSARPTECAKSIVQSFLDTPEESVDTSCVEKLPSMKFAADLRLVPGVYGLATTLQHGPRKALISGGLLALLLISGVLGWPAAAGWRWLRNRSFSSLTESKAPRGARVARIVAGGAALMLLVFGGGLFWAIVQTAGENPFILAFGLPKEAGWLFLLPWIGGFMTLAALVFSLQAVRKSWWSRIGRLHYALLAVGCAVTLAGLAAAGLL